MTLEDIFEILNKRCNESGGTCYRCIFMPLYSLEHPSVKCLLLELEQMFGYKMQKAKKKKFYAASPGIKLVKSVEKNDT